MTSNVRIVSTLAVSYMNDTYDLFAFGMGAVANNCSCNFGHFVFFHVRISHITLQM